jgi:hypothetical protein
LICVYLFYTLSEDFIKTPIYCIDIDSDIHDKNEILEYEFYQIDIHLDQSTVRQKLIMDGEKINSIKKYMETELKATIKQTEWMTVYPDDNLSYNEKIKNKKICGIIFQKNPKNVIISINGLHDSYNEILLNCNKLLYNTDSYTINFSINDNYISYFNIMSIEHFSIKIQNNTKIKFKYIE